jgi:hypothetical protein
MGKNHKNPYPMTAALNAIESRSEVALGGATEAPGGGQWQT